MPNSATDATAGICKTAADLEGTGCATNADCATAAACSAGAGKCYCNYDGSDNGVDKCEGPSKTGTCQSAKVLDTDYVVTTADADGIDGILSVGGMDWWSAQNFCAAHGMHMVNFSESLIDRSKLGTGFEQDGQCVLPGGTGTYGGPCGEGSGSMNNYPEDGKLASTYWWTSELYDSCSAFYVLTSRGYVGGDGDRYSPFYALCVE